VKNTATALGLLLDLAQEQMEEATAREPSLRRLDR